MKMIIKAHKFYILGICVALLFAGRAFAQGEHPSLILTKSGVAEIRKSYTEYDLLCTSIEDMKAELDGVMAQKMDVPTPVDPAGGYTHERHKLNYKSMRQAGILYQVLEDEKYAKFVKEMLLEYAKMYPTLDLHPIRKSYAPGKLFWQSLNEAVWMVNVVQAYDCVYDYLDKPTRNTIEKDLLKPYADFLSVESSRVFNRIHNHGVWAVAAVGMAGYAMGDMELVKRSFEGVSFDEASLNKKSNSDKEKPLRDVDFANKAGFEAQLDGLFSPSGYYTEGPYYHRYALQPFILFALAIENNEPERKIFEYRDGILVKTVECLLQLTDDKGRFIPFNDSVKGMSFRSPETVYSLDIIYQFGGQNPELLSVAKEQGTVMVSKAGAMVAKDLAEEKAKPFRRKSILLTDGTDGTKGGVGFIREGEIDDQLSLILRYTSHGLSHGHFDKLGIILYDNGSEVLQDYGAARFVNVEQKEGGRYLPENYSWAKHTISHNTLVIDEKSHFGGNMKLSSKHHSNLTFFLEKENFTAIGASEKAAYEGVEMDRTLVLIKDKDLGKPLIVDVFDAVSEEEHQYDLAFQYQGQPTDLGFEPEAAPEAQKVLGEDQGYQHLWVERMGKSNDKNSHFTWMLGDRFYTITAVTETPTSFILARLGANDPNFNLRRDPSFIERRSTSNGTTFINVIEPHGAFNPNTELTSKTKSQVDLVEKLTLGGAYKGVRITHQNGKVYTVIISTEKDEDKKHRLSVGEATFEWEGPIFLDID
ncbi:alginate lyase family protein [Flammeovirgaceae bacterium SG7u.111]|nr:alginate lyase family protein [Flammeovirgaceae bacterium SG7u.132]WPO33228.1 alginate lyase family protein [Flammeovirgaceae bacterium SG7u.111]